MQLFTKERVEQAKRRFDMIEKEGLGLAGRWYKEDVPDLIKHIVYLEQQFDAVVKKLHGKDGKNG